MSPVEPAGAAVPAKLHIGSDPDELGQDLGADARLRVVILDRERCALHVELDTTTWTIEFEDHVAAYVAGGLASAAGVDVG